MSESGLFPPLLVVGVDGSPHSKAVLEWAAGQARTAGGRLRVVLGWQFPELPGYVPPRVESEFSEAAEHLLAALVADTCGGLPVEVVVQEGGAVQLLLREAREAALLVVGSHGRGRDGAKLLGSVTQSVLAQARCPVVVVPG